MFENGTNPRNGNNRPERNNKPKWTIMVYLAGDNNLTANCIGVLQQLEAVKYAEDVCVLACFDSNTPWPKGSRYLAINCRRRSVNNGLDWEIHNDLIPPSSRKHDFRPPDFCLPADSPRGRRLKRTGVAEGLKRFIKWSMTNNDESDRYMLILYGHGPVVAGQTFLARENPQSSLRMEDIQDVLAPYFGPKRKLDILACQNCVMNGIETAYEVREQVDLMIGSQGLVLAAGWPYEKIISAIVEKPEASPRDIAAKLLRACARNMIDFSVMDRSSEQSVCDLTNLRQKPNVTSAIRKLATELQVGLEFMNQDGETVLRYPVICDAVRLARLEAQAFWGEKFVDLYDFCERLLKKCNEAVRANYGLVQQLGFDGKVQPRFRKTDLVRRLRRIIRCCISVMEKIKAMVPFSYYIGAELQYSHGLSIFFPWTLPGEPYFFVRVRQDYVLKTAFETYSQYRFVKDSGWADFLKAFFGATLRKVRRADRVFSLRDETDDPGLGLVQDNIAPLSEVLTGDLQKSGSDTGIVDSEVWSNIKNYPRRNYLSPADCPRKIVDAGRQEVGMMKQFISTTSPPVSYLGWNIAGLVAEVIAKPANGGGIKSKRVPVAKAPGKRLTRQKTVPASVVKRAPITRKVR